MTINELHTLILSLDLSPSETITPSHYFSRLDETLSEVLPREPSVPSVMSPSARRKTETEETETVLGKGGMGIVMLGRQDLPKRDVAIKKLSNKSAFYQRALLQESDIMGALGHPNIVPVHEVHVDELGSAEMIMKRIDGKTLTNIVNGTAQKGGALKEVLQILLSVCHALEFAHSKTIVHRDIKADNIMVGEFNEVYLMDWGLAFNLMNPSDGGLGVVGTPHYLAPEMLLGRPEVIDIRTDVYLLGSTLHYIITGLKRHQAGTVSEVLLLADDSPEYEYDDHVPHLLANVANRACSKDPEDRYPTVLEFRSAIEDAIQHWDALTICLKAGEMLTEMKELLNEKDLSADSIQIIHRFFFRTMASFESARDLWPQCEEATAGIDTALYLMIDLALRQHRPKQALSLFNELSQHDASLLKLIQQSVKESVEVEQAHQIAAEHNPLQSKRGRKLLVGSLSAGAVSLVIFALVYAWLYGDTLTTTRLIFTHSILLIFTIGGIILGRHSLYSNMLGKNLARSLLLGSLAAVSNAIAGHIHHANPDLIMTIDLFLLALTFGSTTEAIRSGFRIMIICFISGFACLIWTDWTHQILMSCMAFSTLWALLDWYQEE